MSKAALINMTGVLAKALAPSINVNCIVPGFVETDMGNSPEYIHRILDVPLKRTITPHEVADLCLFLASPESSAITGEIVVLDAGFQLH